MSSVNPAAAVAARTDKSAKRGLCSVSCGATVFMALYVSMAAWNIYQSMFPLTMVDTSKFRYPQDFVHPLWKKESNEAMYMRVYLSTKAQFSLDFLQSDIYESEEEESSARHTKVLPHVLLLNEKLDLPFFSKSFLLTQLSDEQITECASDEAAGTSKASSKAIDESYKFAVSWLDNAEHVEMLDRDSEVGLLSSLSAASGHGIESTSFLLTLYGSFVKQVRRLLQYVGIVVNTDHEEVETNTIADRSIIQINPKSQIWSALWSNSTLHVHVLLLRSGDNSLPTKFWPPTSRSEAEAAIRKASSSNSLLSGQVGMIKYDEPKHIEVPKRLLYKDLIYLWNKHINLSREMPPWVMAISKPEQYEAYKKARRMKEEGMGYPYWKPEVSVKFINEVDSYPLLKAHASGMPIVRVNNQQNDHPQGVAFLPALHVDEMGMTSEKYIPVNETITTLPLRISFDRNDMDHQRHGTTATAGGMSPARWRLLNHLSQAIEQQRSLGFEESDIDEIKRLIADTNITLLSITMLASALHLLFEFLTFKSDVSFWRKNKDLTGLSVRSLFLDMIGQLIILFFLIEAESSLLTTIPSAIGCVIALWKCQRGAGFQFVKVDPSSPKHFSWWNWIPLMFGYELQAKRLQRPTKHESEDEKKTNASTQQANRDRLIAMTIEADRIATRYLGAIILPLAFGYAIYSLFHNEHKGWYSWLISSSASAVYALGFVLMTPQLFLNWKMKSVAHLPWQVLVYKTLTTFIDDLFSFVIRMPTMARLSVFRDDIVFGVYLYQRWLYPVDKSRPIEGGDGDNAEEAVTSSVGSKKTN